jgi:hypothetical protein
MIMAMFRAFTAVCSSPTIRFDRKLLLPVRTGRSQVGVVFAGFLLAVRAEVIRR